MIDLVDVSKTFRTPGGDVRALDHVTAHVAQGEIFGIVGQSGAGKSTLIRTVNGLEQPDGGTITVDGATSSQLRGAELREARRRAGMIFQNFNLLSSRTALGNVELALEIAGTGRADRGQRASEILDLVGLSDRADAYPAQLSGGQKQRVGIARALADNPRVLLSDEATSALDPETSSSTRLPRDAGPDAGERRRPHRARRGRWRRDVRGRRRRQQLRDALPCGRRPRPRARPSHGGLPPVGWTTGRRRRAVAAHCRSVTGCPLAGP